MDLQAYFDETDGHGVLSTSGEGGAVNAAMFAKPHVMDDGTVGFIMQGKRTHANLQINPYAAYLFIESAPKDGKRWAGRRLYLRKTSEEKDTERLYTMRRHQRERGDKVRYLVFFEVTEVLPLSGTGPL